MVKLRVARWNEEYREPLPFGVCGVNGVSFCKKTRVVERLEQKIVNSEGVESWVPVEKVFVRAYCTKIE